MFQDTALLNAFVENLQEINSEGYDQAEYAKALYQGIDALLKQISEDVDMALHTSFVRLSYFTSHYKVLPRHVHVLHRMRLLWSSDREGVEISQAETNAAVVSLLEALYGREAISSRITQFGQDVGDDMVEEPSLVPHSRPLFVRHARCVATFVDQETSVLTGYFADGRPMRMRFDEEGRSGLFAENILEAIELVGLPLSLAISDVEFDSSGVAYPRIVVIEPDYLIDVTAIAECYVSSRALSELHIIKKMLPRTTSLPLILGAIANYFLDRLLANPECEFEELLPAVFSNHAIELSTFNNADVRELLQKSKAHFDVLQNTVLAELAHRNVRIEQSFIEPTFFAPTYGLQGRLDVLHAGDSEAQIIELKSGRPFQANRYGLSPNHYIQTLLYDLLIRATRDHRVQLASYILYSSQAVDPLRFAPRVSALQRDALRVRNEVYLNEQRVISEGMDFFKNLKNSENKSLLKGFMRRDWERVTVALARLGSLEQAYFTTMYRLIAGEQRVAKLGASGVRGEQGFAALWQQSIELKSANFQILTDLAAVEVKSAPGRTRVRLLKGKLTSELANFRKGDIGILYQMGRTNDLGVPIEAWRGTVADISGEAVDFELRNDQPNAKFVNEEIRWAIEHDLLDSSFNTQFRALYQFAEHDDVKRGLFLGTRAPARQPDSGHQEFADSGLPNQVQQLLRRMVNAPDYFLLWGPPGTGKTSIVIRHLLEYYYRKVPTSVLAIAYTNRAVDELCRAIDTIDSDIADHYIRVGSRLAVRPESTGQLLHSKVGATRQRKQVIDIFRQTRIIVGTLFSVQGQIAAIKLFRPEVVILDEASQVLEPLLCGILPSVRKWILVGDHQQLPAVVGQSEAETRVTDPSLNDIGMQNSRTSYFERLYRHAERMGWDHAVGRLFKQGRMHRDIMAFASAECYNGQLSVVDELFARLTVPLNRQSGLEAAMGSVLATQRMVFLPVTQRRGAFQAKVNRAEAVCVKKVVRVLLEQGVENIGVIAPFRSQIALIISLLAEIEVPVNTDITVDTVERYQGSARDVVIMSTCVSLPQQVATIVSLSEFGVDRKLNVAITRAREQFILIGSPLALPANATYRRLIQSCQEIELDKVVHVKSGTT